MKFTIFALLFASATVAFLENARAADVANSADDTCNVLSAPGITRACNAYNNPPAHVKGLIMKTDGICYKASKVIYDDIYKMAASYPEASLNAFDNAAEEGLRRNYWDCTHGGVVLMSADVFLKQVVWE